LVLQPTGALVGVLAVVRLGIHGGAAARQGLGLGWKRWLREFRHGAHGGFLAVGMHRLSRRGRVRAVGMLRRALSAMVSVGARAMRSGAPSVGTYIQLQR